MSTQSYDHLHGDQAAPADQPPEPPVGAIVWTDLSVPDAAPVRDFYVNVVGWRVHEQPMSGGYSDFIMALPDGEPVGGICHQRGRNENAPATWLPYVRIDDLDSTLDRVRANGGAVVDGPRSGFAIVTDPAGAHIALFDPHHASAADLDD